MKKVTKFLRFLIISVFTLALLIFVCRYLFRLIWNFDILSAHSYQVLSDYWNKGGSFNTLRECSLGLSLLLLPIIWLWMSAKIYKLGFWKIVSKILEKVYRRLTRPETMEPEHILLKNIGSKDKTLEEIITDKIKEKTGETSSKHITENIRKEIALKIEENKKE